MLNVDHLTKGNATESVANQQEMKELFPNCYGAPTIKFEQMFIGISTRSASLCATARAMFGVISPNNESAMTIPIGPEITSAFRHPTITAFSPVAP